MTDQSSKTAEKKPLPKKKQDNSLKKLGAILSGLKKVSTLNKPTTTKTTINFGPKSVQASHLKPPVKPITKPVNEMSKPPALTSVTIKTGNINAIPTLPIIPIKEGVLFPSTESILTFSREMSKKAILAAVKHKQMVILLTQKNAKIADPKPEDLYQLGTLAIIDRTLTSGDNVSALVRGISRVKITGFTQLQPMLMAKYFKLTDVLIKDEELQALTNQLQKLFRQLVQMGKPVEFLNFMKLMSGVNEGELADQIASTLNIKTAQRQQILEILIVKDRIGTVITHLSHELKVLEIEKDVAHKTQKTFDQHMKESVLRERLRTIQKELGELDDTQEATNEYEKKLKKITLPKEVKEKVLKEIKHLKQMSVNNPESSYIRVWLDTIFELPWGKFDQTKVDLKKAQQILEKNHYGLKDVKDRVLEYIAVLQLKQKHQQKDTRAPTILCFVGPPGVGKTSIGRSIAEALERKFTKISLGGIRDEAEIRGHRRTYVGAMAGRIVNGIKQAKSMNPVFILDEIDKIGQDFRGDPSAALLEVLDPEQNKSFEDHYLDLPFDLSQVMFITTANTMTSVPPALKDRLEIIRYSGYTFDEKFQIAKRHLLQKVIEKNGLDSTQIALSDDCLNFIIQRYTQEAGVRDLERQLGKVMRKVARQLVEKTGQAKEPKKQQFKLDQPKIKEFLGPEIFDITLAEKTDQVGLATGLAWTSVGGEVLFIEVALTPGKGEVKLTGQLGNVMKESAQAALTYIKAHAKELKIDQKKLDKTNIHVHVPEGAVPKDGPSAGITLTTAMISAFTNRAVKKDVAMTGEVTLRGRVLRIGGLKEKAIAAHKAGVKTIIIPKSNQRDLVEIPPTVTKDIKFIPVETVDEVATRALVK